MTITAPHGYSITINQGKGLGSPWIVRIHKKAFLGRRVISSDWFLEQEQAERFAKDAARLLQDNREAPLLKDRLPGWTLRRPTR
ncbi:MAG TPA: hypothetical protein VMG09_05225 [Bacteroidota bacterium]|nr:hypothetical protein [Bacteroidota bacterium]